MASTILIETWIDALAAFAQDNGYPNVYVGRRSDDTSLPNQVIVFTETQGRVDENMGTGNDLMRPMFNIYHRGAPDDYPGSRDTIHALAALYPQIIATTVHGFPFVRVGGDGMQTPTPIGWDTNRRFEWTLNLPVWMAQPTLPVPTIVP